MNLRRAVTLPPSSRWLGALTAAARRRIAATLIHEGHGFLLPKIEVIRWHRNELVLARHLR